MVEHNLKLLIDIYNEKNVLLDQLLELQKKQLDSFEKNGFSIEKFDQMMELQDAILAKIDPMEEKIEGLQLELQKELSKDKVSYQLDIDTLKKSILLMQGKVKDISELEASVKIKMIKQLELEKENLKLGRQSSRVALDYYKNMSGSHVVPAHFMDQKQ